MMRASTCLPIYGVRSRTRRISTSDAGRKPGYESQREEWERQYAQAQERFMAHKKQKAEAKAADAAATPAEEVAAE